MAGVGVGAPRARVGEQQNGPRGQPEVTGVNHQPWRATRHAGPTRSPAALAKPGLGADGWLPGARLRALTEVFPVQRRQDRPNRVRGVATCLLTRAGIRGYGVVARKTLTGTRVATVANLDRHDRIRSILALPVALERRHLGDVEAPPDLAEQVTGVRVWKRHRATVLPGGSCLRQSSPVVRLGDMPRSLEAVMCPVEQCGYKPPFHLAWDDDEPDGRSTAVAKCRQLLHEEHAASGTHPSPTVHPRSMPLTWQDEVDGGSPT